MGRYLIEMFGGSLLLTIAVELAAAFFFSGEPERGQGRIPNGPGGKGKMGPVLLIVLVNVLTNPPAVLLCWLAGVYLGEVWRMPVQIFVEIAVVTAEAYLYCNFAEEFCWGLKHPVRYAVTANLCSWLTGVLFAAARGVL